MVFILVLLLCCSPAFAQLSPDSVRKEQEKIASLARNNDIRFFATARELARPARSGDAVVLQDDKHILYFAIIDSVRSLNSIRVILYPKPGQRELAEATYDDLYYLKPAERPKAFSEKSDVPDYIMELAARDKKINQMESKMNQAAFYLADAGKSYETSDILRYTSIGAFTAAVLASSLGSLAKSPALVAGGTILFLGSVGAGV